MNKKMVVAVFFGLVLTVSGSIGAMNEQQNKEKYMQEKKNLGWTDLHFVVDTNNCSDVEKFIKEERKKDKNFSCDPVDNKGKTPLEYLLEKGLDDDNVRHIASLLVKNGAGLYKTWIVFDQLKTSTGKTKLLEDIQYNHVDEIIHILLDSKLTDKKTELDKLFARFPDGSAVKKALHREALTFVIARDLTTDFKTLFNAWNDVGVEEKWRGCTLLCEACFKRNSDLIAFLLAKGADVNGLSRDIDWSSRGPITAFEALFAYDKRPGGSSTEDFSLDSLRWEHSGGYKTSENLKNCIEPLHKHKAQIDWQQKLVELCKDSEKTDGELVIELEAILTLEGLDLTVQDGVLDNLVTNKKYRCAKLLLEKGANVSIDVYERVRCDWCDCKPYKEDLKAFIKTIFAKRRNYAGNESDCVQCLFKDTKDIENDIPWLVENISTVFKEYFLSGFLVNKGIKEIDDKVFTNALTKIVGDGSKLGQFTLHHDACNLASAKFKILLKQSWVTAALLNERNFFGETVLHCVAERCIRADEDDQWVEVIKIMLNKGADPSIWNKSGRTAFDCATLLQPLKNDTIRDLLKDRSETWGQWVARYANNFSVGLTSFLLFQSRTKPLFANPVLDKLKIPAMLGACVLTQRGEKALQPGYSIKGYLAEHNLGQKGLSVFLGVGCAVLWNKFGGKLVGKPE